MKPHKDKRKYRVFVYERLIWTPENYEGDWNRFEIMSQADLTPCVKGIIARGHEYAIYVFPINSPAQFRSEGSLQSRGDAYTKYLS